MKLFLSAVGVAALLTGCPYDEQKPDPALLSAQISEAKNPSNRFVVAGKREYSNGTEIYVLDGKSGQVCYYFVASGRGEESSLKTDMRSCAGDALNPLSD